MSLTLLTQKLDKLNEKEKLIRQRYDVRGLNRNQHRYIHDLKEDFKEDLILRYGDKPYGLGWNQENEHQEDQENQNPSQETAQDVLPEKDEESEKEKEDLIVSNVTNQIRPTNGKVSLYAPKNRPFSASTIRPMTASSSGVGSATEPKFVSQMRPVSGISKFKKNITMNMEDISEFGMSTMKTPHSLRNLPIPTGGQLEFQGSRLEQNLTNRSKVPESNFWKNTKKYDVAQSTKQFNTKQLVFDVAHSNTRLIAATDLAFLNGSKMNNALEASKLKAPKNYEFEDIATKKKKPNRYKFKGHHTENEEEELDSDPEEAQNVFNESLSYIHTLRVGTPSDSRMSNIFPSQELTNKNKKHQRPVTAHPQLSSTTSHRKPLEVVKEQPQENYRIYFSSLSDTRKKMFFLKLNSMDSISHNHPNNNKQLQVVQWELFKEITAKEDFQSLHLILLDLNTFDHAKHELEFKGNILKAKGKEEYKNMLDIYKDFVQSTRTNLVSILIYYETTSNKNVELFSRIVVYEKDEDEYDSIIWRNIYRFLLHKVVMANSTLYPDFKTYQDLSKMIKDIIEDKKDYISPISSQIQKTKDHPIVVERNGNVYNFDFHSYIIECSSHYAKSLTQETYHTHDNMRKKEDKPSSTGKPRPYSAINPQNKFSLSNRGPFPPSQEHHDLLSDSSTLFESLLQISPHDPSSSLFASPHARQAAASIRLEKATQKLNRIVEEYHDHERMVSPTGQEVSQNKSHRIQSARTYRPSREKVNLTLQGDKLNIYGDMQRAQTARNESWRGFSQMMMPSSYSSDLQTFATSRITNPQALEEFLSRDPNGITLQHKSPRMKKKTNVVINRRPQSGITKGVKSPRGEGNLPSGKIATALKMAVSGNTVQAPYQFKP